MVEFRKLFRISSDVLLTLMILFVGFIYLLQFIGIKSYIVRSGSMEPAIMTGSLCLVNTHYDYHDVSVDDVIAFKLGDTLVTHRVIQTTEDGFVTKGDNNTISDGLTTTEENYVGKNVLTFPYLGYVIFWIQSRRGKMIVVTMVMTYFIIRILLSGIKK